MWRTGKPILHQRPGGVDECLHDGGYFGVSPQTPRHTNNYYRRVAACKKYLSGHPGTVSFAVGVLAKDFKQPVNDQDFDVSIHMVFTNKAAQEQYAKSEKHLKFIEENKANWKEVRVFDSYLEP
jgi:hypothetical protein